MAKSGVQFFKGLVCLGGRSFCRVYGSRWFIRFSMYLGYGIFRVFGMFKVFRDPRNGPVALAKTLPWVLTIGLRLGF